MSVSTADLKRLGDVKAPAGLADRVLAVAGLADEYARFDTVIGAVFVAWNRSGVSAAARSRSAHEFEEYFRAEVRRPLRPGTPPSDMAHRITDELSGKRTLRFDLRGLTEFEQAVLRKAREIPYGQVRPYSWLARAGVRYQGVKTTGVYCYPTCHHGRRALERNVVWLRDADEAKAAGFRPCKVCRPAA